MSIRMHVDDTEATREMDHLLNLAGPIEHLERILAEQFQAGQAAVHVITGSLRASEEIDSDYRAGRWAGQVSFGGPSPGFPNDPVVYAVYEAARGGAHDFRIPVQEHGTAYRGVVRDHLGGPR